MNTQRGGDGAEEWIKRCPSTTSLTGALLREKQVCVEINNKMKIIFISLSPSSLHHTGA